MKGFLYLFFLYLFFIPNLLLGQSALAAQAGARGIGMGNASITYQDIHSSFNNQAGLAHLDGFSAVAYAENRFLLEELNVVAFSMAQPTQSGTWGLNLQYFGFEAFNEQKVGLNYSRLLFEKLAIGGQFDFLHTSIPDYGNTTAFTFELGLQYQLSNQLSSGIHLYNPIRATIGNSTLPTILQIGLTYNVSDALFISSSIEKDTNLPYNFRVGLEYQFQNKIHFRTGLNSNPNRLSFGVGYSLPAFQINVAATYHDVLGISPTFGIVYRR